MVHVYLTDIFVNINRDKNWQSATNRLLYSSACPTEKNSGRDDVTMRQLCLHPGGSVVPSFVYSLRGDRLRRHRCRAAAREIRAPRSYKPSVYGGLTLNCGGGTLEIPSSRINIRLMTCFDCKLSLFRTVGEKVFEKTGNHQL